MGIFEQNPYSNIHNMNLDWMIRQIQDDAEDCAQALTTAQNAQTAAASAVSTANTASATAQNAQTAAASAVSTANTASATASSAVTTANSASQQVTSLAQEVTSLKARKYVGYATGSTVTITDGAAAPVISLKADIVGTQSGSGDPSPTNVRPLSVWTGANIDVNGTTITIQFGQTVYSGTLNVLAGLLTVYRAIVYLGDFNWTRTQSNASGVYFFNTAPDAIPYAKYYPGETMLSHLRSSMYKPAVANTFVFGTADNGSIGVNDGLAIRVRNDSYTDSTTFKTAMSGVQLCYELATPLTVQLTPQEVNSLSGSNSFSADCGDVSVIYIAKE